MTTENRRWLFIPLAVFVVLAGAAVGGYFGTAAGDGYATTHNMQVYAQYVNSPNYNHQEGPAVFSKPHNTLPEGLRHECHSERWVPYGNMLGSIGGAATGGLWSLLVWRRRKSSGGRIVAAGIGWGIVAGLATTALLHAGLLAVVVNPDGSIVVIGLIMALIAGAVTGLVCGIVAAVITARMRQGAVPAAAPSEATPPRESNAGTPEAGA
jgi:hypothetical protein